MSAGVDAAEVQRYLGLVCTPDSEWDPEGMLAARGFAFEPRTEIDYRYTGMADPHWLLVRPDRAWHVSAFRLGMSSRLQFNIACWEGSRVAVLVEGSLTAIVEAFDLYQASLSNCPARQ